ncbi:MAG: TraR/DksA C4-type zinc finger protein [Spirochaetia bacterium]|nr:TraR/DksA C4-type zinc finger protein [Spirochaetia bacterium]MCF7940753.1 TraR/DksA C4-type zinc finger protein [Spirochaetia bacterium]
MKEEELKLMKEHITAKIEELESSMTYLTGETKPIEPSISLGRLTRMEAISEKGINEYVLEQNRQTLVKLRNALERIEKGTYGVCIRCGKDIPLGRLTHVPEALICVPCAEKRR